MADWPLLIRAYRKEHGLKQTVLAYMLNVDQTTVSRWERGKDRPSVVIQKRLRDLFCSEQDAALSAVSRTVRFAPGRAAIMLPGTRIVEISDGYFDLFQAGRSDLRGGLMRHFVAMISISSIWCR
ncbi:MAG: helix-turn-helix transcriptional regulator [Motiliproteus sp.]